MYLAGCTTNAWFMGKPSGFPIFKDEQKTTFDYSEGEFA
jgi:hypothetical protein